MSEIRFTSDKNLQPTRAQTFIEDVRKLSLRPVFPSVAAAIYGNKFIVMPSKTSHWLGENIVSKEPIDFMLTQTNRFTVDENLSLTIKESLLSVQKQGALNCTSHLTYTKDDWTHRIGGVFGERKELFLSTSNKLSDNCEIGIGADFTKKGASSWARRVVAGFRYENCWLYLTHGDLTTHGINLKVPVTDLTTLSINPYYYNGELNLAAGFTRKLEHTVLKVGVNIQSKSINAEASVDFKVAEGSKIRFAACLEEKSFLFKIGLKFNKYVFSIPILKYATPKLGHLLLIAPFLAILQIVESVMKRDREAANREAGKRLQDKRGEVLDLVYPQSVQSYQAEKEQQGLIIHEAYYGDREEIEHIRRISLSHNISSDLILSKFSKAVDVTIPLQFYVKNSRLQFQKGSKRGLIGFQLPEGLKETEAVLYIQYTYRTTLHETIIEDQSELYLP